MASQSFRLLISFVADDFETAQELSSNLTSYDYQVLLYKIGGVLNQTNTDAEKEWIDLLARTSPDLHILIVSDDLKKNSEEVVRGLTNSDILFQFPTMLIGTDGTDFFGVYSSLQSTVLINYYLKRVNELKSKTTSNVITEVLKILTRGNFLRSSRRIVVLNSPSLEPFYVYPVSVKNDSFLSSISTVLHHLTGKWPVQRLLCGLFSAFSLLFPPIALGCGLANSQLILSPSLALLALGGFVGSFVTWEWERLTWHPG